MQPAVIVVQTPSQEPTNCCGRVTQSAIIFAYIQLIIQVLTVMFASPMPLLTSWYATEMEEKTTLIMTVCSAVCAGLFIQAAFLVHFGIKVNKPDMLIGPIVINVFAVFLSMAGFMGLIVYVWGATVFYSARDYLKTKQKLQKEAENDFGPISSLFRDFEPPPKF